jgi:hypothetical protein
MNLGCAFFRSLRFVTSLHPYVVTSSFQEIIMTKSKLSRSRVATDESSLCQFSFADGRTCRMFRHQDHPSLCIFHARAERQIIESDRLGSELAATLTGRFMTATDINFALGKLYKAIAQNRVPPRNASNLAFVGKLLLLSLDKLKEEFAFSYDYKQWKKMYLESKPLSNPPSVSLGEQQSANSAAVVPTDGETTAGPGTDHAQHPS